MGAFLAANIATIFSSHFTGLGSFAGGPFGLSDIWQLDNRNMDDTALAKRARGLVEEGFKKHEVDNPKNLKNHRVYV